jgi:hypothetical protein
MAIAAELGRLAAVNQAHGGHAAESWCPHHRSVFFRSTTGNRLTSFIRGYSHWRVNLISRNYART